MWIRLNRAVGYKGEHLEAGQVVEVDDAFGARQVWLARASEVAGAEASPETTPPQTIEGRDPAVETRDPEFPAAPARRTRRGKP
jgi:hypothetical protein